VSAAIRPQHRTVLLNEHEAFWLDCIRVACNDEVPEPTLARAQALRRLFAPEGWLQEREEAGHGQR
jgi:hypothetical protein